MNQKKNIGRYIVSDIKICHGKLTFKGTRIFVDDVLDMVAEGLSWNYIIEQWHGAVTKDAIKEAVFKINQTFIQYYNLKSNEITTLNQN